MKLEQLIIKAKELGIENAESLKEKELKAAIAEKEAFNELVEAAKELGIETEGLDENELYKQVLVAENSKLSGVNEALKERIAVLTGVFGIEDKEDLSAEELSVIAKEKVESLLAITPEAKEAPKAPKGKTDKPFKASSGKEYRFTAKAPAAFRFAGVVKTQEDWLKDKEAMELLILGNSSYLEVIFKK